MRKIHMTRQFFEAIDRHGDFFQKNKKKTFLDKVHGMGVCVPNFSSVSFFVWPGGVTQLNKYIHKYTSEIRNILDQLLASQGFWKITFFRRDINIIETTQFSYFETSWYLISTHPVLIKVMSVLQKSK